MSRATTCRYIPMRGAARPALLPAVTPHPALLPAVTPHPALLPAVMPRKVTIVAGGHLSTCPRMLKAADALAEAGYAVRVITTVNTPWARAADLELHARRRWRWETVDYTRDGDAARWLMSGVRTKSSFFLARGLN